MGKAFIMDGNESNKLMRGALLLSLAGIISKVLSAGYRIPLQNLTGDIGFYIYQQVYPLLGMAIVLGLYGFPSAISKLTVDLRSEGKEVTLRNFYKPVFIILSGINISLFLLIYLNAPFLAAWIGDINLIATYQNAAFIFLFIPFVALLRGVFQGNNEMKPTAYSQIGEQIIRVFIIIVAAVLVAAQGSNIYHIGKAAGMASIGGILMAIFILGLFAMKNKPLLGEKNAVPWKYYGRIVFILGIVAAMNHMILLVIQIADAFTLVPGLIEHGLTKMEAMRSKGIFDRGQPLIQIGTVLGSSFALALIPTVTKEKLQNDSGKFSPYIQGAIAFSFYLAAGAAIGLIMIFPEVNILLYKDDNGTIPLQILAIAIFLSSIVITTSSILQGMGYIKRTAGFIVGAFLIKWTANQILVPLWGIAGGAVATVLSLILLGMVTLMELKRRLPGLSFFKKINGWAFLKASFGMIAYLVVIDYLLPTEPLSRISLLCYVCFVAITGAMIYLVLLLRCRAFTEEELAMLPFAACLIRIHKGRNT